MLDTTFLDWPFFDQSHRDLALRLDDWCQRHIVPLGHSEDDVDGQCRYLLALLAEGGWLRYAVPKAYGGTLETLDVRSLCLIRETLGRYSGLADFVFAMQGLGSG
ncbi:MAG: acyl-CoA dehydrogenase family protein, partial [Pseudomonadota bacterium]